MREQGIDIPKTKEASSAIHSRVYYSEKGQCLATIVLGDSIRQESPDLIRSLHDTKTVLLSGDSKDVAASVAASVGIQEWHGQCHPLEKREHILALKAQNHTVAMLGDGINDAPALTAADIGISVVSATDMSIQVSDILLTTDKLSVITKIRKLAQKGQRIIRQNLFWAFFYNVVGIPLAISGQLSPLFAALAMVLSSLFVIINSLRLKSP